MAYLQNFLGIVFLAVIFYHSVRGVPFLANDVELGNNSPVQILSIESIAELVKEDPSLQVEELTPQDVGASIVYQMGKRTRGDKLVAHTSKLQTWPNPVNAKVTINYPSSGVGARISYIYILVTQSTYRGKAYVIKGGIGQRFITVAVEGFNVTYMHYSVNIFGY